MTYLFIMKVSEDEKTDTQPKISSVLSIVGDVGAVYDSRMTVSQMVSDMEMRLKKWPVEFEKIKKVAINNYFGINNCYYLGIE